VYKRSIIPFWSAAHDLAWIRGTGMDAPSGICTLQTMLP